MRVCIIGMGYAGLPLAVEFARGGLEVTGIDVDPGKAEAIDAGRSYVEDVPDAAIAELRATGKLAATTDFGALDGADAACICVPTPLRKSQDPDISYIVNAVEAIVPHLHSGMLVVLESTTYPGTTEELVLPRLEATGLKAGTDFFLAFSPERVDPGNAVHNTRNTPKIVGGVTPACTAKALELYRHAVDTLVPVSNARTAEMVKILENAFRAVNIGFANEIAIICGRLGIDVWEVIDAAKTKPFGFMPFYPGPGLGGHCLPVDPRYLSWKLKTLDYDAQFIELASTINANMPRYVVEKAAAALNGIERSVKGSRILVLGAAYKQDIADTRESPALDIIALLKQRGAKVAYADPHVPELEILGEKMHSRDAGEGFGGFELVLIATAHSIFDYARILAEAPLVLDTRNATAGLMPPPGCTLLRL